MPDAGRRARRTRKPSAPVARRRGPAAPTQVGREARAGQEPAARQDQVAAASRHASTAPSTRSGESAALIARGRAVEKLAVTSRLFSRVRSSFARDISRAARRAAPRVPFAGVAELVDARDLGSRDESRGGSSPSARTTPEARRSSTGRCPIPRPTSAAAAKKPMIAMQVTETLSDGLKREFQVTVPAADLEARVVERLGELKDRVRINGFRPGKVPVTHLQQGLWPLRHGRDHRGGDPRDQRQDRRAITGSSSPWSRRSRCRTRRPRSRRSSAASPISPTRWRSRCCRRSSSAISRRIKLERLTTEVTDAEIDEALEQDRRAEQAVCGQRRGRQGREGRPRHHRLHRQDRRRAVRRRHRRRRRRQCRIRHVHSGLRGSARSAWRPARRGTVNVTFPADYPAAHLAGKEAEFEVTAKSIEAPGERDDRRCVRQDRSASNRSTSSRRR